MKKGRGINRKRLIPIVFVAVVVSVMAFVHGGMGFKTAYVIKTTRDTDMVLMDNSPVVIRDETPRKKAFDKYSTGDKILLLTGPVAESWPGRAEMHWCIKLDGGNYADIPQDIRTQLAELGYIVIGDILLEKEKAAPILMQYQPEIEFIENTCNIKITIIDDITMDIIKSQAELQAGNKEYRFNQMMTDFAASISEGEAI